MSIIQVDISAVTEAMSQLSSTPTETLKAFNRAARDTERHAKTFIAKKVTGEYAISGGDMKGGRGTVNIKSEKIAGGMILTYKGRTLTLAHFPYTPKKRTIRKVKVKTSVKRGPKKSLGKKAFIGPTGTEDTSKIQSIPFKRLGQKRLPIMPVYTLSAPQMVTNEKLEPEIANELAGYFYVRFSHQYKAIMNGWTKER